MSWNWLNFWHPRKKSHSERGASAPRDDTRGADAPRSEWNVVMYTRQGCHLCEQAWQQLEQAQQHFHFALHQVDIDAEAQLAREYGECVPVVAVNGRVRFRGVINPVLLKRLLEAGDDHI